MTTFYRLLIVTLLSSATNNFVWFALTYWAYLTTRSVVTTSIMAGAYLAVTAASSAWLGSLVDAHRKKSVLLASSSASLALFFAGLVFHATTPAAAFAAVGGSALWILIALLGFAVIAGNVYGIAMPTIVGIVVPEGDRERANGMYGTVTGVAYGINSITSGIVLANGGIETVLRIGVLGTLLALVVLTLLDVREPRPTRTLRADGTREGVDLRGTLAAIRLVPGLAGLILFATLNNLLNGAFFSLMDAYGLSLMDVEAWGVLWGTLSLALIAGGLVVSRRGLGARPLRALMIVNLVSWGATIFFALRPSVIWLSLGVLSWMFLYPFAEAAEQTIFQKAVPKERLGRVFGLAHGVEQAASPVTALLIGPFAQYVCIPFMTTGKGVEWLGPYIGVGEGRGIALVFTVSGIAGLVLTLAAMRSKQHRDLAASIGEGS